MEFAILGPVEARLDGEALPLGGPKQRALLAILLLRANEPVSRDQLIEGLWGERPPRSVDQSLDSYVSRLRRLLGADRLRRRPPGYVLAVAAGELDLERFDALVARGRDALANGDPGAAREALVAALAIWRGPAFADVLYEPFAAREAAALEERRLRAIEDLVESELQLGDVRDTVARLERLVAENPLRERLLGLLMRALYRAGRQADALSVFQEARRRFAVELGLEPSPELKQLELGILNHDRSLAAPVAGSGRLRRRRRRRASLVAAGAIAAAALGTALAASVGHDSPVRAPTGNGAAAIDVRSGRLAAAADIAEPPSAMTAVRGSLWITSAASNVVDRLDGESGRVADRVAVGGQPGSITSGAGAIWVGSAVGGTVTRIDPTTDSVTQTIRLGGVNITAVAFAAGRLWVADATDDALIEVEPASGTARRTVALDVTPTALASRARSLWVAAYGDDVVEQIDPISGQHVSTVHVGHGPSSIAAAAGGVWVVNNLDSTVSRVEPSTGSVVATIPVGSGPTVAALDGSSLWVACAYSRTVDAVDTETNRAVTHARFDGRPTSVVAATGKLWVATASAVRDHRGGTLTLVRTGRFAAVDPASELGLPFAFSRLVYDTLVSFQASPGPDGFRLVPDLAISTTAPIRSGTAYTFRIRPGIRYSNGERLRPSDFRRALERLFRVRSPGSRYFTGLVGAEPCMHEPARCDLSRGVVTSDATGTVSFHLRAADPDFPYKLAVPVFAAPVPRGTPDREPPSQGVPGTGPYRVGSSTNQGIRLVRNAYFREWSHAAQPAGNPDVIRWRYAPSFAAETRMLDGGAADWIFGYVPPPVLRRVARERPAQVHAGPQAIIEFIPLNAHAAPFDDVRVRRALNYALDRRKIARMYGGSLVATPTCQPLVPGMAGYRRDCPYTSDPHAGGAWYGPDRGKALRLVEASGTRGERVDVWGTTDEIGVPPAVPAYVASVLRRLGYRVQLHRIPSASITSQLRRRFQLSVDGDWFPDYPSPSSYIPQFFGCHGRTSNGYVCDRELEQLMRRAEQADGSNPGRAAVLWRRVDRMIVNRAYWVPTELLHEPELVSRRVRNFQYSPVGDFIADQVWLEDAAGAHR